MQNLQLTNVQAPKASTQSNLARPNTFTHRFQNGVVVGGAINLPTTGINLQSIQKMYNVMTPAALLEAPPKNPMEIVSLNADESTQLDNQMVSNNQLNQQITDTQAVSPTQNATPVQQDDVHDFHMDNLIKSFNEPQQPA